MYTNQFIWRYGHCNFTKDEVLAGFELMVEKAKLFRAMQLPEPTIALQAER